jgi:hypothetical protein
MSHEELLEAWFDAEYAYRSSLSSSDPGREEKREKALELRKRMARLLWDLGT